MKVLLCRADSSGCAYYRVLEPAAAVAEQGLAEVEVVTGLDVEGEVRDGQTIVGSVEARGADVVVLQRPTRQSLLPALDRLQRQGVAVVVEVDDLLGAVDPQNAAHSHLDPAKNPGANHRWVLEAAQRADWVTVSTPELLREYARHGRGSVVRNAIPRRMAELPPAYELRAGSAGPTVIGWTGSVATHPQDLQTIGWGLRAALESLATRAEFSIIGQANGAQARLELEHPVDEISWFGSVDHYLEALGSLLDIGLAPLRDDRFNRAKSWLKPLEYAARGIYCVRANLPEYAQLGLGYHAKRPRDWQKALERLVQHPEQRLELARMAREQVLRSHLTEHTATAWFEAWTSALEVRRAAG